MIRMPCFGAEMVTRFMIIPYLAFLAGISYIYNPDISGRKGTKMAGHPFYADFEFHSSSDCRNLFLPDPGYAWLSVPEKIQKNDALIHE
jgi:hypothetical protein